MSTEHASEFESMTCAYGLAALSLLRPHLEVPAYKLAVRLGREIEYNAARRELSPRIAREAKLEQVALAAQHAVNSLLAVREAITDDLLQALAEDLRAALAMPRGS